MSVLGIGELLWDCFDTGRRPGGAPANVAYHAQLLGRLGIVCSRVGNDLPGKELRDRLSANGLATSHIQIDEVHATSWVTVDRRDPANPRFTIHENVAWDFLQLTSTWLDAASRAQALCFGTLAQRCEESRKAIQGLITSADGALRIYDVNIRPPWYSREIIDFGLRHADIVKLNQDEVSRVCTLLELPVSNNDLMNWLGVNTPVSILCVTRGSEGCSVLTADHRRCDVPGEPVQAVDTVGSGDAFTAAFIHGTLNGWPIDDTARFANQVGAIVASHEGAMPEVASRYHSVLKDYAP